MTTENVSPRPRIITSKDEFIGFKTDLHCHTSEASFCAKENAKDTVERYIAEGYSTIVITNHFATYQPKSDDYHQFVDWHFDAIELAKEAAGDRLNILAGAEINVYDYPLDDFLAYGVTRELMHSMDDFFNLKVKHIRQTLCDNNCLLIKAHPMRHGQSMYPVDEIDGYELYNGYPYWKHLNPIAKEWIFAMGADKTILTAGTDHHNNEDPIKAGILTDVKIKTNEQLIDILKNRRYDIFYEE